MKQTRKLKRHFIIWVLLIGLGLMILGASSGEVAVGLIQGVIPMSDAGAFLMMYLSFIGIDVVVLIYCGLAEKDIFRSMGPGSRGGQSGNRIGQFLLGLLVGFAANGICILAAWLHGDVHFSVGRFQVLYMLAALVCVCVQSGAEELLTRGYMLGALRERYNVWVAVAANSLFFGVLHVFNDGVTVLSIVNIVLVGAALSLVAVYMDSLWMCIAIHTAWNFTQNFLFGLPNSGIVSKSSFLHLEAASDSLFYDVGFGVESTVTAALVMIVLGACAILAGRKRSAS